MKLSIKLLSDKDLKVKALTSSIIKIMIVSTHLKKYKPIMIFMSLLESKKLLIWKNFPSLFDE
jgi:hypothetical protein